MNNISVGILVSYDYPMLMECLGTFYSSVDEVVLCIDRERKTWKGGDYVLPELFFQKVAAFDTGKKIRIYEDTFYLAGQPPMALETRQRTMLAAQMGPAKWYVQLDVDEKFLNFSAVVSALGQIDVESGPVQVNAKLITLFKKVEDGILVVGGEFESLPFATNHPVYARARHVAADPRIISLDILAIHETWARDEASLLEKITNWGHSTDFNISEYFEFWKSVNRHNYRYLRDLHPVYPGLWPSLFMFDGNHEQLEKYARSLRPAADQDKPNLFTRLLRKIGSLTRR